MNNAGVGVTARLVDTPLADYDRVMNVNVRGYLLYAQHAYPHLARRRGCMIHIASDAGIWGEQATGLYSVTKAAVVMLGKMLALDGGPDGVRSNVLCPGDIWPGMRHMAPPGEQDRAGQDGAESGDGWPVPPIGRVGQAGDVAAAAVFYASDQAEFITGTTLLVDGGMTAGYLQRERVSAGLEAGFGPAAEHLDLLLRPGAVAGHRAVAQALQDAGRVRLHVGLGPQVEGERHRLAVVLAEQRLDVRREADRLVRPRQGHGRFLLGRDRHGGRRARGTPVPGGRRCARRPASSTPGRRRGPNGTAGRPASRPRRRPEQPGPPSGRAAPR